MPRRGRWGDPRFYALLERMADVHSRKSHDYAGEEDWQANFRLSALCGVPPWVGAVVRMTDKLARLAAFAKQGELEVPDERVEDTLLDLANYALLTLLLYQDEGKGG